MSAELQNPLPGASHAKFELWLRRQEPSVEPPIRLSFISGGRSNLSYQVQDATGNRFVLRRAPADSTRSHNVRREHAILSAMAGTGVPAPRVLAFHDDPESGGEFFVMEFVDGVVLGTQEAAARMSASARRTVGVRAIAALAQIHAVDVDGTGLGSLRRPGSLVERQLRTFLRQQDPDTLERWPGVAAVHAALATAVPQEEEQTLVHGDFKLGNLIFSPDGDLLAVLDWELSAIGDPRVDLGWLLASWVDPGEGEWVAPPPTHAGDFLSRQRLVEEYCARTGREVSSIDYFVAFAHWRWACINIGTRRRFVAGAMADARIDVRALERQIGWQLDSAGRLLGIPSTA